MLLSTFSGERTMISVQIIGIIATQNKHRRHIVCFTLGFKMRLQSWISNIEV